MKFEHWLKSRIISGFWVLHSHFPYEVIENRRSGYESQADVKERTWVMIVVSLYGLNKKNKASCRKQHCGFPSKSLCLSQGSSPADTVMTDTKMFTIRDEMLMHDEFQG